MNTKCTLAAIFALSAAGSALASGFGLYEPSAKYHAMGGAVVGKAIDASANFANPATLTDLTNMQISVGFVTEHPRGTVDVRRNGTYLGEYKLDPGLFWLPHIMFAAPLPADFTFGLGISAEYGLGTEYGDNWPMNWSCYETTVQGLVINPNIAYKITDDWSIGAGLRWLYFDFEQYKKLMGKMYRLKGDNSWDGFGGQIGTKYDICDNFSVGLDYKTEINTSIEGKSQTELSKAMNGPADADITLPQSVTFGFNYEPFETWRLGMAFSWTEWSEFDQLIFHLVNGNTATGLQWKDTWRGSIGSCWDFAEDWSWLVSYTYDMDCTRAIQESAMLPPASRHILATGFVWRFAENWDVTISYSCIFMNGYDMHCVDRTTGTGAYELKTKHGFCHAGGFSLTYYF